MADPHLPGMQQAQKQTQTQILTPQAQQSLKILQASALELRDEILKELQANPTLEEASAFGNYEVKINEGELTLGKARENGVEDQDGDKLQEYNFVEREDLSFEDRDIAHLNEIREDWREYYALESSNIAYSSDQENKREYLFNNLVSENSLQEHLMRQAELVARDNQELETLQFLIGSLDDNGFLENSAEEIKTTSQLPIEAIQKGMKVLKAFDPPGVGCIDLQESLLVQLKLQGKDQSLAFIIVQDYYSLLLKRKVQEIAHQTHVKVSDVQLALEEIAKLDPAPGRRFSKDHNQEIVADITIFKDDSYFEQTKKLKENKQVKEQDIWRIVLNNDYIPRLSISALYKQMLAEGKIKGQEKEYIQEKMRSGRALIQAIEQRQSTLYTIAEILLDKQKDFFEKGISHLKPLKMKEAAEVMHLHPTTVGRTISGKYVRTPHGVFGMKYFFTGGFSSDKGKTVANTSVKERIAYLLDSEDSQKPLSDQDLVSLLAEENIKIARRTVAKYREELNILPVHLRKREI